MEKLPQLTAIEFPGVLRNPKEPGNAIAALGGEEALRTALSSLHPLTLNLRPFPNASPSNIISEQPVTANNLFLLRITRRNPIQTPSSNDSIQNNSTQNQPTSENQPPLRIRVDLVARISCIIRFRCLADFQYHLNSTILPDWPASIAYRRIAAQTVYDSLKNYPSKSHISADSTIIDRLRPRRFARTQREYGSTEYWFKQYAIPSLAHTHTRHLLIPGKPLGDDRRSDAKRLSILHHRVSMLVEEVPTGPPPGQPPVLRGRKNYDTLHTHLTKLFDIRPVWVRRALHDGLPETFHPTFKRVIQNIAYSFHGPGPFYQAWIRYGYDPRKDPESRKYQVVEVRTTNPVVIAAAVESTTTEDEIVQQGVDLTYDDNNQVYPEPFRMPSTFTLSSMPRKRNNFIQVCDISLSSVVQFCRSENVSKKFDPKYGFFTEKGFNRLMKIIKDTLLQMAKNRLGENKVKSIQNGDFSMFSDQANKRRRTFLKDVIKGNQAISEDSDSTTENDARWTVEKRRRNEWGGEGGPGSGSGGGSGVEAVTKVADLYEGDNVQVSVGEVADNIARAVGEQDANTEDEEMDGRDERDEGSEDIDMDGVEGYEILGDDDGNDGDDDDDDDDIPLDDDGYA